MITLKPFPYKPGDHEAEKASNSYLMSLVAILVGLPLPIFNLLATFIFFLNNKKGTYFVRWHCTQALFSQISMVFINSVAVWWGLSILFGEGEVDSQFITYLIVALAFNLTEFIATIYTSIKVRKGIHVEWWFYGEIANRMCKEDAEDVSAVGERAGL